LYDQYEWGADHPGQLLEHELGVVCKGTESVDPDRAKRAVERDIGEEDRISEDAVIQRAMDRLGGERRAGAVGGANGYIA
jgi:hypothetical protein